MQRCPASLAGPFFFLLRRERLDLEVHTPIPPMPPHPRGHAAAGVLFGTSAYHGFGGDNGEHVRVRYTEVARAANAEAKSV